MISQRPLRGLLLWFGAVALCVLVSTAAGAQSEVDDPALLEEGEAVFSTSCMGCHGADGTGSDFGRPLTGIAGQEPDRLVHIGSVTMGKGGMPAFGDDLTAEEIDAAVTYVRLTFLSDRDMDELPNTGIAPELFAAAAALIAVGAILNETARRRRPIPA